MNVTFFIGNGFDIGIGLKTRYEDFYKEYCKINSDDSNNIIDFKQLLKQRNYDDKKKIIDWADFEKAFGEHAKDFSYELKATAKAKYIERFEDFVFKFNEYLEKEEANADFSNDRLIGNTMNEAVKNYYKIRNADRLAIEEYFKQMSSEHIYNFISFNYTKTLDECVKYLRTVIKNETNRKVENVVHIHGYIDENMIMGVNDSSQINDYSFANDIDIVEELVKPNQNEIARTNYENQVITILNNSDIICTYGMSIGETDKKWWDMISNWLLQKDNRVLIILKHEEKYNKRFPFSQKNIINNTIENFLSFSSLSTSEKENIQKRIFAGINNDIFAMNLRKKENSENITILEQIESVSNNSIPFEEINEATKNIGDFHDRLEKIEEMLTSSH